MEANDTPDPDEDKTMTNVELIKVAAIKAILESIEEGDEEDAKAALRLVKALLGETK